MLEMTGGTLVGLGILGGCLPEIVRWYQLRESPNRPIYSKSLFYWAMTIVMILVGGVVAYLYSLIGDINAILAVNIGASAPLIISTVFGSVPKLPEPPKPSVKAFLKGK